MRMRDPSLVLALFLTLCSLSQAQSGTAELSAVLSVCGGVVIILCLVWLAICVAHWRTERDFCQFKKRLRERREQYRRHHRRQLQQYQQYQQYEQRGRRNGNQTQVAPISQPATSPHLLAPHRFKPTLISQSASMEFTNQPSRMTVNPPDRNNQSHPPSNGQKKYLASERRLMQQPQPLSVHKNGAVTSLHLQAPKTPPPFQVPTIAVDNDEHTTSSLTNQVQPSTLEQVQGVNSPSGQQMHRTTPQMPRAVLGPYSPRSLREVEEVDLELDSTNTPPRYSWLFPERERLSQSDQTSPYSFLTPASTRNSGRGRGKTVQDMAIYGQLTSWPQLA